FSWPILFQQQYDDFCLTCFDFNGAYLMVETDGYAKPEGKTIEQNAGKLRFNVTSLELALETIRNHGIATEISVNDWGSTINIFDPDGNRVGIREEASFAAQIDHSLSPEA
ncbi:MAG: glyoxalase/bleomycin resistance/dioxygenase family protein, partial [Gammaproteobacteria bacterium]|nr:glyoxalase/bleomycin resistance/dioxygenase family protein [Gammaproteobacteria bacterium]